MHTRHHRRYVHLSLTLHASSQFHNQNVVFLEAATGKNPNAQAGDENNEFVAATIR